MKMSRVIAITVLMAVASTTFVLAQSAKLSCTQLSLNQGKSKAIKVLNTSKKVKWGIIGKKYVTLKVKGNKAIIKAGKKTGTCYVKATIGKKVLKCKVTVKPIPKPIKEVENYEELTQKIKKGSVVNRKPDQEFEESVSDVSVGLLQYLQSHDKAKNILISPDSILTAMAMTENGAQGNTLTEMEAVFGLPIGSMNKYLNYVNENLKLNVSVKYYLANSIWFKKNDMNMKEDFLKRNVDYFSSQIFKAPFNNSTVSAINGWVYKNTDKTISKIVDKLDSGSAAVILNAVVFEGEWSEKYDDATKLPFKYENGTTKKVDMLCGKEDAYINVNGADGFVKPYKGGRVSFVGLETPKGMTVDNFVSSLKGSDFVEAFNNISYEYDVYTKMPKFKYDYDTSLVEAFKSLGMKDAFDKYNANFNGMAYLKPGENLKIDEIRHKTHIELDENGTKATAATAVSIFKLTGMPVEKESVEVDLDHPFVYAIIDEYGTPLFIGVLKTV